MKNLLKELILLKGFSIDFTKDKLNEEEIENLKLIFYGNGNVNEQNKDISFVFSMADKYYGVLKDGTIFYNLDKYTYNRKNYNIDLEIYDIELLESIFFANTLLIEQNNDELNIISFPVKIKFTGVEIIFETYDYFVDRFIINNKEVKMQQLILFNYINDFENLKFHDVDFFEEIHNLNSDASINSYYYISEIISNGNNHVHSFFRRCYSEYEFYVNYIIYVQFKEVIDIGLNSINYITAMFNDVINSSSYRFKEKLDKLMENKDVINSYLVLNNEEIFKNLKLDITKVSSTSRISSFITKIKECNLTEYLNYYLDIKGIEVSEYEIVRIEEMFDMLEDVSFDNFIKFIFRYFNTDSKQSFSNVIYRIKNMIETDFKNEIDFTKSYNDEYERKYQIYKIAKDTNKYKQIVDKFSSLKSLSDLMNYV